MHDKNTTELKYLVVCTLCYALALLFFSIGYFSYFGVMNPQWGDCESLSTNAEEEMCADLGFIMATVCEVLYIVLMMGIVLTVCLI